MHAAQVSTCALPRWRTHGFKTPLRYPGGKGRLGPWIAGLMRHNRISGGWYVEPYAGGAGAAIMLLAKDYVNRIVINDADPVVYAFWWAILNDTDTFIDLLERTPVTMDSWHKQKEIHANPDNFSKTEVGFATLFLNRTNRSGILTAGVIGGKNQTGPYPIDARFRKEDLHARISFLAGLKSRIAVHNLDAIEFLAEIQDELPARSLIYLDPPYYDKGSKLYRNFYRPDDHAEIAETVRELKSPWLVTYDNCSQIRELYTDQKTAEFSLQYSTGLERPRTTEVMFYGNLELHEPPWLRRA